MAFAVGGWEVEAAPQLQIHACVDMTGGQSGCHGIKVNANVRNNIKTVTKHLNLTNVEEKKGSSFETYFLC